MKLSKAEKYRNLKRTLREVTEQDLNLVSVSGKGAETPYRGGGVLEQEYVVWFSNGSRHLLLSNEAVDFALKENLGKIKESILYFARQKIEEYLEVAKQEKQAELDSLLTEKISVGIARGVE